MADPNFDLAVFEPRGDVKAHDNLSAFIDHAKTRYTALSQPGVSFNFDSDVWDITGLLPSKSRAGYASRIRFRDWDTSGREYSRRNDWVPFPEPFLSFAKAMVRHDYQMRPVRSENNISRLQTCLAALCEQLCDRGYDVAFVTAHDFDMALNLIIASKTKNMAYQCGSRMKCLVKYMNELRIVARPVRWMSFAPRPESSHIKVGPQFDKLLIDKMPDEDAIDALGHIFSTSDDPIDLLVTSICAIMLCAPVRANEVLRLTKECEIEQEQDDKIMYGLRWFGSKGYEDHVKWIPELMVPIAKKAINNLKHVCAEGYRIAEWYVNCGCSKVYLPKEFEMLRGKSFTVLEFARICGKSGYQAEFFLKYRGVKTQKLPCPSGRYARGEFDLVDFRDFEQAILKRLPKGFPVYDKGTGLGWNDVLIVLPFNFTKRRQPNDPFVIQRLTVNQVNGLLGPRKVKVPYDIFHSWGFKRADGGPMKIATHQFRHLLNTLAQRGGLSQVDIARWSGRTDVNQNRNYDHMSGHEIAEMVREVCDEKLYSPLKEFRVRAPISRDEYLRLKIPAAHLTELGVCIHDFSMMPCQRYMDCINCTSHVCIKGDQSRNNRIRQLLVDQRDDLKRYKDAVGEGLFNADRWLEKTSRSVCRLEELVSILDDPHIPEGSVIQLSQADDYSRLGQALEARQKIFNKTERRSLTGNSGNERFVQR